MWKMQVWAMACVVATLCPPAGIAEAATPDDLISQGIKLRQDGRDQEALPLFREALKQQPTPRATAQLGTCEQALGLWVDAEVHLRKALENSQDAWMKKNEATLRSALAQIQQRLGSIEVWGTPAGARVSVDGEFIGALPMNQRARAPVGQRLVTVEAPAFFPEQRTVELRAGALLREHVSLRPIAALPTPGSNTATPLLSSGQPTPATPPVDQKETPIYRQWWFWTAVGVVAVTAGGTAYYFATRNNSCQGQIGGTCTTF
jgi:hypothetical protein